TVGVTNSLGGVLSTAATLVINADTNRPTLVSATESPDLSHVTVTFSKPVTQSSVQNTANYSITGLTVNSAVQSTNNPAVVVLTTSAQKEGTMYNIVINNIIDQSTSGNMIQPNSQISFTSPVLKVVDAGGIQSTNGTTFDVGLNFSLMPSAASA